jgi:hypothetical protein
VRDIASVSLGCELNHVAMPHPDTKDPDTLEAGIRKRCLGKTPIPKRKLLRAFKKFVKKWLRNNLVPFEPDLDLSIETWLKSTHYPLWRKEELRKEFERTNNIISSSDKKIGGFLKDETYPEYKVPRGIYARKDACKLLVGPIFKHIEKTIFDLPYFIKHIPKTQRAQYIYDHLYSTDATYFATDFTSFEGCFTAEFINNCEYLLYEYMCQNLPCWTEYFKDFLKNVIMGNNVLEFKFFTFIVKATRMSGEMNTSLGNGFSNFMMCSFIADQCHCGNMRGVFEGDDGLFTLSDSSKFDSTIYNDLGFIIKIEEHLDLNTASFCGNVFDIDDKIIITNPIDALVSFGHSTKQYSRSKVSKLKGLARAKAMSLLYEYSGAPLLQSYALFVLRNTQGYRAIFDNSNEYLREQNKLMFDIIKNNLPIKKVGIRTRLLMEKLYNIPVEMQIKIENYFDNLKTYQTIDMPFANDLIPEIYFQYSMTYSKKTDKTFRTFDFPELSVTPINRAIVST